MNRKLLIPLILVMLLMSVGIPVAMAAPDQSGVDTIVESGEVVNNDIVLLDGDLEVHENAVVNGDVVLFNGDAAIDGDVNGSVTLFNGSLVTGDNASISGDCVLLNGQTQGAALPGNCTAIENVDFDWAAFAAMMPQFAKLFNAPQAPGIPAKPEAPALPEGMVMPEMPNMPEMPAMPEVPAVPEMPAIPESPAIPDFPAMPDQSDSGNGFFAAVGAVVGTLLAAVVAGFLALVAAAIAPENLRQISAVTRRKTVTSGAAGALTAVAVPSLMVLLVPLSIILTFVCIGLLGFPLILLLGFGLVAGVVVGWIAVGTALGDWLFNRRGDLRLTTTAALGTGAMTLGVGVVGLLSFGVLGGLATFAILAIGLGAVALTQFGRKPYPRRSGPALPVAEDPIKIEEVMLTLAPDEIGDISTEKR